MIGRLWRRHVGLFIALLASRLRPEDWLLRAGIKNLDSRMSTTTWRLLFTLSWKLVRTSVRRTIEVS